VIYDVFGNNSPDYTRIPTRVLVMVLVLVVLALLVLFLLMLFLLVLVVLLLVVRLVFQVPNPILANMLRQES